jgi:integrase
VVFWSTTAKTTRRLKLGNGSTMPLSEARKAARAARHEVEGEGRDPQAERAAASQREREERQRRREERQRAAEARRRRSVTFGQLCQQYVDYRRTKASGRHNRTARPNTLIQWASMLKLHILPTVGTRPPEDMTAEHFGEVLDHAVEHGGPSMGPRVRELLSAVWRWIEERPRKLGIQLPAVSPLVGLRKVGSAQKERERALSPAEVWRFWRATEKEGNEGVALRLMLMTATRVREATDIDSSELDLERATWTLPAARNKGGRERVIPLSPQAVALLRGPLSWGVGSRILGGAVGIPAAMDRVRAVMGGKTWQARDLRRTAATRCAILGADPFVVAGVLGHAKLDDRMPAVTKTYLRHDYEGPVREALNRLGAWVENTVSRATEPGDVVSIEARR